LTAPGAPTQVPEGGVDCLRSALYEGRVSHRRFGPGVEHSFSYRVAMPLLYLDEVDAVTALHPLWSSHGPAPMWFRRQDFLGGRTAPLAETVRGLVEQSSGRLPAGPVALLANWRSWGWITNPISLYFCMSEDGKTVESLVAEVENTPWHERCSYVVGPPGIHRFAKVMHVSPFMPMDLDYKMRYTAPGDRLVVCLELLRGAERMFSATLSLRKRELDRRTMSRFIWDYPALTHRISAGIYAQAARLHFKGAPFFAHPARRSTKP